jgi:hypothetical protein
MSNHPIAPTTADDIICEARKITRALDRAGLPYEAKVALTGSVYLKLRRQPGPCL